MKSLLATLALAVLAGCSPQEAPPAAVVAPVAAPKPAPAPAKPKADHEKTVLDVALGSPDHTTLVAAVKAAGADAALASPGGIYTVFAPTNAAFEKLPPGTVEGLLKPEKQADLKKIVKHHAAVPILETKDMKDGQTMSMSDGSSVTFHVKDGKVMVDDANIVASIKAVNGVVHVVDAVVLPK